MELALFQRCLNETIWIRFLISLVAEGMYYGRQLEWRSRQVDLCRTVLPGILLSWRNANVI